MLSGAGSDLTGSDVPFGGLFALSGPGNAVVAVIPAGELIGMDRTYVPDDPEAPASHGAIGELVFDPEPWINWTPLIGDGVPQYAGFLLMDPDVPQANFGWMQLLWNPGSPDSPIDDRFDVLGWAVEMTPFVPIRAGQTEGTIPEPGMLWLSACGVGVLVLALCRRRPRSAHGG